MRELKYVQVYCMDSCGEILKQTLDMRRHRHVAGKLLLAHLPPASWYLPVADVQARVFLPHAYDGAYPAFASEFRHKNPCNILERILIPALGSWARRCAYLQSSVDLARTAMAMERYRLAHGEFPESLDALAPQFIAKVPHDVIDGQPLKYRREANGQFV